MLKLFVLLGVIGTVLKAVGVISLSWWVVTAPFWGLPLYLFCCCFWLLAVMITTAIVGSAVDR